VQSLPTDDAGLQAWLFARFQRKERLMKAWNASGYDLAGADRMVAAVDKQT
jgi:hypothetical protein